MAYANIADMVLRFGEAEMMRATVPDGQPATEVVPGPVVAALDDASAMIDSYLRKRYHVPLTVAPPEINRACCILARYDLNTGGDKAPSEQTKEDRKEVLSWLERIARGLVLLGMEELTDGEESFAEAQSRGGPGDAGYAGDGCGFWTGGWTW